MTTAPHQHPKFPLEMASAIIIAIFLLTSCAIITHPLMFGIASQNKIDDNNAHILKTERYLDTIDLKVSRLFNMLLLELRTLYAAAIRRLDNTILNRSADHPTHDVFVLEFRMVPKWEKALNETVEDAMALMQKTVLRTELEVRNEFGNIVVLNRTFEHVFAIWQKTFEEISSIHKKRRIEVSRILRRIQDAVCKYLPNACDEVITDIKKGQQKIEYFVEEILEKLIRSVTKSIPQISDER